MINNKKGISMVSLVVIIIVTIILLGVAITGGYTYIEQSKKSQEAAIVKLVSDAATKRQNDKNIDGNVYYEGYPIDKVEFNKSKVKGLPEEIDPANSEDIWYILDANSAQKLGVVDMDKFICKDIKEETEGTNKVLMVDYDTGETYIVEIDFTQGKFIEEIVCDAGGDHLYSVFTCEKGSYCIKCGTIGIKAGHSWVDQTCTKPKTCSRCGITDPEKPALGHNYEIDEQGKEVWVTTDPNRHWKACTRCGAIKDSEEHTKVCTPEVENPKEYHVSSCLICDWISIKEKHQLVYEVVDSTHHQLICKLCGPEPIDTHEDGGWKSDVYSHWRECDKCGEGRILENSHIDDNGDHYCDVCGKAFDDDAPVAFTDETAKVTQKSTNSITVSVLTTDIGVAGMKGYSFAFGKADGSEEIKWQQELASPGDGVALIKTFSNLEADTEYCIYVKASDNNGNETETFRIKSTTTTKIPSIVELENIPEDYTNTPFTITVKDLETPYNISVEYSIDNGATWHDAKDGITINKEDVKLIVRARDDTLPTPNYGEEYVTTITKFDGTAPEVTIEAKKNDDVSKVATSHTLAVTLTDEKSGIPANEEIHYAWSQSNTIPPSEWSVATTSNSSVANSTTVEIDTKTGVDGEWYLWIKSGVKDVCGNERASNIVSPMKVMVDDKPVTLENIKMFNENPAVEGQKYFANNNSTVDVTFTSNKKLSELPKVKIGGATAETTSTDMINFTAKVKVTQAMPEGMLGLGITNVVAESGKEATKDYTQADLVEGPVIHDSTAPVMEYINK